MSLLHWLPNIITATVCFVIARNVWVAMFASIICGVAVGMARQIGQ